MLDLIMKQTNIRDYPNVRYLENDEAVIDTMTKYYEKNCPEVPEVLIQAFKEEHT